MSSKKTAVITGICGQDGSYLADLLVENNYQVIGIKRRTSSDSLGNAIHLKNSIEIVESDLGDLSSLSRIVRQFRPDEFYNLGAMSHVGTSFDQPVYTMEANTIGVVNCLEAIRLSGIHTRFYQASSSEMFGGGYGDKLLNETTPFHPRSPYGVSKTAAHQICVNYREAYRMFICCGILFNHESARRTPTFVTRKITKAIAEIKAGRQEILHLGNLSAKRDWGHARDYVRAMHLMLSHSKPDDYVVATGLTWSVQEFLNLAFEYAGLDTRRHVRTDPSLYRPAEVDTLIGDSSKIYSDLGWCSQISFEVLVEEMVDADLAAAGVSLLPRAPAA
jgi:GDPmannose 4,6-dehydratase